MALEPKHMQLPIQSQGARRTASCATLESHFDWLYIEFQHFNLACASDRLRNLIPLKTKLSLFVMFAALLSITPVFAQNPQTVTVNFSPLTLLSVTPNVNLSIDGTGVVAGVDQMTTTDQSSRLSWGTNATPMRITVATGLATQKFALKVLPINVSSWGASTVTYQEVTLTIAAQDLLLGVGCSRGYCDLKYTGVALASQGVGLDTHTITFTITN